MKSKRLLKFYFFADGLDGALNNLIYINAYKSGFDYFNGGEYYAEKILEITRAKERLGELWGYLDGVISALSERDKSTLKEYAQSRVGLSRLKIEERREIKRAVIKFRRHARNVEAHKEALALLNNYYCLVSHPSSFLPVK